MNETNEKIGQLISNIRQQRGMTQKQLATKLGTSQSAINRIEKGGQNLSIDMLGRISDVLNKQLLSISGNSISLNIEGGHELRGEISVKSSKNACVGLLFASLLNKGTTKLRNVARIEEVLRIIEVLTSIGVDIKWTGQNTLIIKAPEKLKIENINSSSARKTRSVLMALGPLIHSKNDFKLPYAGGCKLGKRSVEPHLFALENFGVDIVAKDRFYHVKVKKKLPTENIVLYERGDTVTENAIMAAAGFEGVTTIKMASENYMVQDVCQFLQKLGIKIEGIGTSTLVIHGKSDIRRNITYTPSEDPVEAMTFVAAAVTTNSTLTIKRIPEDFMALELLKLKKMGLKFEILDRYKADNEFTTLIDVKVHKHNGKLVALEDKIHALPYPGINIDNLPYFVPISAVAHGRTMIHDWVYEGRAIYYTELSKLGVDVELADPHRCYINGPTKFNSVDLVCPPALRPAVLVLIAMLAAPGISRLRNIYTINRGYEDLAERLNSIGAKIQVIKEI